ncbi:uncharacterized protein SRS1_13902 [Sporisorium reilianum f. sp. reilianum]|uniref:Uncharacterized protein n=1 Tax=Sporisorium reilianum f. sp. reilianum TaxID=72559 RepID=A0A2N8UDL4_9BASI|nr:uncharacterized protein SRS1_13902 [Sporisorium reilianum f. sp. reilianum]
MRFKLLFLVLALLTALVFSLPPSNFRNQLHVFQTYARDIYPDDKVQQKKAVVTLRYLFRNPDWNKAWYWHRIDDFLRTGGLKSASKVAILAAIGHFEQPQVIEDVRYSKPSLDKIIKNNKENANKHNQLKDHEILNTPRSLGSVPKTTAPPHQTDMFKGIPRPFTQQELEMYGLTRQRGSSSNTDARGKRISGADIGQ